MDSKKLDLVRAMMDCLLAKCIPCITDCVMGELEKLGGKYKIALRLAKDPRFERIPCNCKGCYADDCITQMAKQWRCFIVATCDKELRGRVRKIPGVPCMYISGYKYTVERMPEAFGAPRWWIETRGTKSYCIIYIMKWSLPFVNHIGRPIHKTESKRA